MFKDFLWNKGEKKKGGAKVAWKDICRPKDQGGLGLKDLGKWNELFLVKHIWKPAFWKRHYICRLDKAG